MKPGREPSAAGEKAVRHQPVRYPRSPKASIPMTQLANTHLAHGMKFDYPAGWLVTEERSGDDLTLTAADEGIAFWSVTLMPGRPDPKKVLKMALTAFEEAY